LKRYKNATLQTLKPYLLLAVILLLAYLPVSSFHFAMKNDAFSDNFPNKFFLSESLRSGFMPLWNPYLNFGFPIYADPGFAFWNPITWIFAVIAGYNAYTLTVEVLLYIYIAGAMMYRLGRHLSFSITSSVAIAGMYMCSGFFTGELQHINFLTAAAFLPYLLQQFLVIFQRPDYKTAFLVSTGFYMVFAGGHPAIPIGTVYFLLAFSIGIFLFNNEFRLRWKKITAFLAFSVLFFVVLASPAIYSYVSLLSDYARASPVDQSAVAAVHTGFSPSSYLSFLYPFATVINTSFFSDDLSMRNVYISLAGFVLALTQLFNRNYLIRSLAVAGLLMLILSCGGNIKTFIFSHLPLLAFVKTNGEYRVFVVLAFCILAGTALNGIDTGKTTFNRYKTVLKILLALTSTLLIYLLLRHRGNWSFAYAFTGEMNRTSIKAFIDRLSFPDTLIIAIVLNLVCIIALLSSNGSQKRIAFILLTDMLVNSLIYLPFSGVGRVTLAEIDSIYGKSPKGIIIPPLVKIKDIEAFPGQKTGLVGSSSYYNKNIGTAELTDYPSYFRNTERYFTSELPQKINNHPYLFFKNDFNDYNGRQDAGKLKVKFFSPTRLRVELVATSDDSLVLLQNHYRFWKANVDGVAITVNKSFITFMSVPVPKGVHTVEFYYDDRLVTPLIIFSITGFIILIARIYRPFLRSRENWK
jgi:hypothetical protein